MRSIASWFESCYYFGEGVRWEENVRAQWFADL